MELILNSYGVSLHKKGGNFSVYTPEGKQLIPADKVKSITIGKGARVTSDAVMLAIEHEIDLMFTDRKGMPQGRIWSVRYGSIASIRRAQLEFLHAPAALPWIKEIICTKIDNQIAHLLALDKGDRQARKTVPVCDQQHGRSQTKTDKSSGRIHR